MRASNNRSTLRNPLLFRSFLKQAQAADPDFDPELIDRNLEPEEAKSELRRKHGIVMARKADAFNPMAEFRNSLFDMGIKHPRAQNFVMRQEKPAKQDDLDLLAYVFSNRPHKNWKMDIKRKAKPARTVAQYARNPNRYDIAGVDTPGSMFDEGWF